MTFLPSLVLAATEAAAETATEAGVAPFDRATYELLISLIPLLPILGFAFTALFGRRLMAKWGRTAAEIVPVGTVIVVWVIALLVIAPALMHQEPFGEKGLSFSLWTWIPAGDFTVDIGFHVDALTAALLIVVTTIGMLVHIYSRGYMAHDPAAWRFFAYLNLFMFSMLLLVLADNFVLLFAAWELVGLSSYLLIGFWYARRSAALAAKKAFLVNRVGDFGFALGIAAVWTTVG
ncbi:MAG TPA: proton-conducting transporter membrane subunit, partial [Vicinamibacterales bacterium]